MCMPISSRYCLICLLVYLLLPNSSANSVPDPEESPSATYAPLVDKDQNDPDETKFLQLSNNPGDRTDNDHDESTPQHYFIHSLMRKYGNGTEMTFEGFEHLLENIGLGKFLQFDHSVKCHRINGSSFIALHSNHNHTGQIHSDAFNRSCDGISSHVTHSHDHHESEEDHDHRDEIGHEHDHTETGHEHVHAETGHEHVHAEADHVHTDSHVHEHNETHQDYSVKGHEQIDTDHTETVHEHKDTEHTDVGHDTLDSRGGSDNGKVKRHLVEDAEKQVLK